MHASAETNVNPSRQTLQPVCPCDAHGALSPEDDALVSHCCARRYHAQGATWDFILGERFNDEPCECMWCNEEKTGRHLVENYMGPLLARWFPADVPRAQIRILSIGCGVGSDVEALNELGYSAYGIDAGNRAGYWSRRSWPERYFLANAKSLPFADASFDVILMGCVLPHIGVGDDTYEAQPGYRQARQQAADEMLRVTRPGGILLLSSPNRKCPVDFFHRADVRSHMPRLHSVKEAFLLSVEDYADLLAVGERCEPIEVLPLRGYWGFYSSSTYWLGRILQMPVRFYFNQLMSWRWTAFLRRSALNPWLILQVRKKPAQ